MNNDLISISEVKSMGATCLARRNENGQLEAVISLDNAPTVTPEYYLADEVWKLYEKHHSHLATHVLEFGYELKELLGKYQKGGVE